MEQKSVKAAPIIPVETSISKMECQQAFNGLEKLSEKLYCYYFARACWSGAKACYFQRSYESPALFYVF